MDRRSVSAEQLFLDAPIAAVVVDTEGTVRLVNAAFAELAMLSAPDLSGRRLIDLFVEDDRADVATAVAEAPRAGRRPTVSASLSTEDDPIPVELFSGRIRLGDGTPAFHVQVTDGTAHDERLRDLQELAFRDGMTGLLNRRGFDHAAEQLVRIARRERRDLTFMFIDIEGLKAVNDVHGHSAGDQVIERTGAVLCSVFRDTDVVGRYGGDEFCVLSLTRTPDSAAALHRRLLGAVSEAVVDVNGTSLQLSVTVGLAHTSSDDMVSLATLVDRADADMYRRRSTSPA